MDETKRPFSFQPEPDLQAIQPLSYDTNTSKKKPSRRSIGAADAAAHPPRAEHGAQDGRAPAGDREAGRGRKKPSRVVIDGRSMGDGEATPPPDTSGILPLPTGSADELARRAARSAGRTVVVEHQRIVVRRNLEDEEFPSPSTFSSASETPGGGDSRFPGSRSANRRRRRVGHVTHGVD